ncbi:MAG: hypothetical protein SP1CHLAM42_13980 [Chlamydiales bacterium]|nr:hypothetical protein [Chlamydiales bacterium]
MFGLGPAVSGIKMRVVRSRAKTRKSANHIFIKYRQQLLQVAISLSFPS